MPGSYALGRKFEQFIDDLVDSGRYNSKSEVVREGLRMLQAREETRETRLDELRNAFRAGMESGPGLPAETVLDRLSTKYARAAESSD